MDNDLMAALRSRGVGVTTPIDSHLVGKGDEEQLAYATSHECVFYSFNICDFYRIHEQWINAGREHAGMILASQHASPSANNCTESFSFERQER